MLTIRQSQIFALQRPAQAEFEAETLAHLERHYPIDVQLLGAEGMLAVMRSAQVEGQQRGLETQGDMRRFITLRLVLGSGLLRDPLLPWAVEIGQDLGQPGALARLQAEAAEHLELAHGADGHASLRAMLRAQAMTFEAFSTLEGDDAAASSLRLLRRLWPERFRMLPIDGRPAFLQAARQSARAAGLDSPGATQFHTAMMFLLGCEYHADPALPWAAQALAEQRGAAAEARARALHEAGIDALARLRSLLLAKAG